MSPSKASSGVDLLIEAGAVVTMDAERRILRNGAVAVSDGRISWVGKQEDFVGRAERTIDARSDLLMPGLIDAHNHPLHYMTKGTLDDTPFMVRQANVAKPYEETLSEEESYLNSLATFIEMIENGTTCFSDTSSEHPAGVARAASEIGIRGVIGYDAYDNQPGREISETRDWQDELGKASRHLEAWNGASNGRLTGAVGLRGASSEGFFRRSKAWPTPTTSSSVRT